MANRASQEFPFFQVSNTVIGIFGLKIGPYGIAVYSALAYHANREGGCFPSLSTIATETGMCRRKVISTIGRVLCTFVRKWALSVQELFQLLITRTMLTKRPAQRRCVFNTFLQSRNTLFTFHRYTPPAWSENSHKMVRFWSRLRDPWPATLTAGSNKLLSWTPKNVMI